jgi:hypothetical protein
MTYGRTNEWRSPSSLETISPSHGELTTHTGGNMAKLLVHITCGPNDPSKAALAFFVARAAVEEGHTVAVFLAGDG